LFPGISYTGYNVNLRSIDTPGSENYRERKPNLGKQEGKSWKMNPRSFVSGAIPILTGSSTRTHGLLLKFPSRVEGSMKWNALGVRRRGFIPTYGPLERAGGNRGQKKRGANVTDYGVLMTDFQRFKSTGDDGPSHALVF
jgi:hypothetical protein